MERKLRRIGVMQDCVSPRHDDVTQNDDIVCINENYVKSDAMAFRCLEDAVTGLRLQVEERDELIKRLQSAAALRPSPGDRISTWDEDGREDEHSAKSLSTVAAAADTYAFKPSSSLFVDEMPLRRHRRGQHGGVSDTVTVSERVYDGEYGWQQVSEV